LTSEENTQQQDHQQLTSLLGSGGVSDRTATLIYKALV